MLLKGHRVSAIMECWVSQSGLRGPESSLCFVSFSKKYFSKSWGSLPQHSLLRFKGAGLRTIAYLCRGSWKRLIPDGQVPSVGWRQRFFFFDLCLQMFSEDSPSSHDGSDRRPKCHSPLIQHFYTIVHVIFGLWEWEGQRELWRNVRMVTLQQLPACNHVYLYDVRYRLSRLPVVSFVFVFVF